MSLVYHEKMSNMPNTVTFVNSILQQGYLQTCALRIYNLKIAIFEILDYWNALW
ncbi:hypothetical protein HYD74_00950 [Mycoplasmopsis bovis]|nr:hypothetical protein HYD74_00950 [Mycoplasmopsis bovis]